MGPNAVPHEARIDVLLDALPTVEAKWLRVVTTEIDHVNSSKTMCVFCVPYSTSYTIIRVSTQSLRKP